MRHTARLASLALGFALVVGCDHARSSSAAFRDQANRVCAKYAEKANALERSDIASLGPVIPFDRRLDRLRRPELRELRQLKPPPAQMETFRRWLAANDKVDRLLARQTAVSARDLTRIDAALRTVPEPKVVTPEDLKHPTEAILSQTLEPLPEWHAFLRHQRAILRQARPIGVQLGRLGRELGLKDCLP